MRITEQELIQQIERAEQLYKTNLYMHLQPVISNIQEHLELLTNNSDYAKYYRIYMLYIGIYEELNMQVLQSYLQALININEVEASDYEYVCSYYKQCEETVYQEALMLYPYNETLHLHYALKLQEDKRFKEAIVTLKYILECYPASTEARFLLWDIEATQLAHLCASNEEANCYELLELASATHNEEVLKGLQLDHRLDKANQTLAYIQVALWEERSTEIKQHWNTEWKLLELTAVTRMLLADYAKSFMMYDMVSQVLKAPSEPEFPEEEYSNFEEYQTFIKAFATSGWQLAQHQYVLIGNSAYFYSNNKEILDISVERGLALNPKNPLLLVLKAKSFFFVNNYNETGVNYHEAFKNGLRLSEYLFYLLEVNSRIENWQGILDIVAQFHKGTPPTLKTLFFKARALVKLRQFDEALDTINVALSDFPLPPHSYAPWLYNLRMIIHKQNHNYTAFFEDMQSEINYYTIGDSEYCSTMNMCIEALIEMGNYQECYKYAIYNHEQGQLLPELYPVFLWICFYDYLEKPDDIADASELDLIQEPSTFIEYRTNGLIYWMLGNICAATNALQQAAQLATNKAYYLKLALSCAKEDFNTTKSIAACQIIKTQIPESSDWKTDYLLADLLKTGKHYKKALASFNQLLQSYPDYSFFEFPKDNNNMMLATLKTLSKAIENEGDYIKYNAMLLSKENPSANALLEHLEVVQTHFETDKFLLHNLLGQIFKLNIDLENNELELLKDIKSKIRTSYFN